MAMFPPTMPRVFIDWLTKPGDAVYDPFSGRGTTVLEACDSGRIGLGSDANPLARILTSAKANPPTSAALNRRLRDLRRLADRGNPSSEPPEIRAVFDPDVLAQLLWLRSELSTRSAVDRYLFAALLGILHANARSDGSPRGLTISMPNTFSMAPRYVMRFKAAHRLVPPKVDVLDALEARIRHLGPPSPQHRRGHAWLQDATSPIGQDPLCEVGCPYAVRGFDFDYIGLLWLGDLKWRKNRWIVDSAQVHESGLVQHVRRARRETDSDGPAHQALLQKVRQAYRILMTRAMRGMVVWFEDEETRERVRSCGVP